MIDLELRTSYISKSNLISFVNAGYLPILICRFLNPLVEQYKNTPIHFIELSPSYNLFCDVKYKGLSFQDYTIRYMDEMKNTDIYSILNKIKSLVDQSNAKGAVLMCYEKNPLECHRSILSRIINELNILPNKVVELYN